MEGHASRKLEALCFDWVGIDKDFSLLHLSRLNLHYIVQGTGRITQKLGRDMDIFLIVEVAA